MSTVQIKATDGSGSFSAYHAPATGDHAGASVGAVVLIQEIFGVNKSMRETADAVAALATGRANAA